MENKENEPRPPPVSSQYARRVLREINTSQVFADVPKTQAENPPAADDQENQTTNQSAAAESEPAPGPSQSIFPDIRPEAFSRERRTLRNLAGRIYLIYCHLCCLDKKFRLSESDVSFNSDNEVEEMIVNVEDNFFFGQTPEIELEKMILNTARYSFGGSKTVTELSTSSTTL